MDEDQPGGRAAKDVLRATLLAARAARPVESLAIARATIALAAIERGRSLACVAAYIPLRTEPGSVSLLDGLAASGVLVLVPVVRPDRDLSWTLWSDGAAGDADLGVAAVAAAELVFVPALAVDHDGYRLGRGGGSYDRALARVAPDIPVVALVFDDEVLDEVPVDPWDRPVTEALTPSGWVPLGVRAAE